MFELLFGLFIIVFVSIFFLFGSRIGLFALSILLIFLAVGLYLFIVGVIRIIRNFSTSLKGEECYSFVSNIVPTGKLVNDNPIYKALFVTYVPSLYDTREVYEEIGIDSSKYPIGSFVKVKYYNDDVNIIEIVDESVIPLEIVSKIKTDVDVAPDEITVDGVKYKRV